MADSTETRQLILQLNATTELLRSQMAQADQKVGEFATRTQANLDRVDARFDELGKGIGKLEAPLERLKSLGETALTAVLGESLLETGKKALEFAGNIEFVSQQVGTSTEFLQKYRFAASQFGVSNAQADEGLGKFARSVGQAANGNKELSETFDRLGQQAGGTGIKVRDAGGNVRSVEAVFLDTATAIAKLPDPAQKAADVMQLFGKQSIPLVPLLNQGAAGFDTLAAAAERLGVVLSSDLIEHSEEVNHKFAAMKEIIDAQMANAIAANATSILSVANALERAAGAVSQFLSKNPREAVAILAGLEGLNIGSKFGPAGAAIGAVGGAAVGYALGPSDPGPSAAEQLRKAQAAYAAARAAYEQHGSAYAGLLHQAHGTLVSAYTAYEKASPGERGAALGSTAAGATNVDTQDALGDAQRELAALEQQKAHASGAALTAINEEIAQKKREIGFIKQGADAEMASSLASKQGSAEKAGETAAARAARKAEEERVKGLEQDRAYQNELRAADEALLKVRVQLQGQLDADLVSLRDALAARDLGYADQVAAGKMKAAQALELEVKYGAIEVDEETLAERKAQARTIKEGADRATLELSGQAELLQLQDQLSLSRKDRLKFELQLLDYQEQEAKIAQQAIIDSQTSSDADKAQAARRIGQIDAQHAGNVALIERREQSPLAAYRDQLTSAVGDMNDALQGVAVDGFKDFEEGFTGLITGTKSVAAAFKDMADSIIADLARIAIEKAISGALGGLFGNLFGGGASSSGAGIGLYGGARAGGGAVDPGRVFLVGEQGPELFVPPGAGTIVPNAALRAPSIPSLASLAPASRAIAVHLGDVHIDARGATTDSLPAIRASVDQLRAELPVRAIAAVKNYDDRSFGRAFGDN